MSRRTRLESPIQAEIEAAIGAEPDLLLLRNTVGHVKYYDEKTGEPRYVTYGLGKGSPDLVGILRIISPPSSSRDSMYGQWTCGRWFCLEIKAEEGVTSDEQKKCHETWRSFGAFIATVRNVREAREALALARGQVGPS